jgi:hypothetical protein
MESRTAADALSSPVRRFLECSAIPKSTQPKVFSWRSIAVRDRFNSSDNLAPLPGTPDSAPLPLFASSFPPILVAGEELAPLKPFKGIHDIGARMDGLIVKIGTGTRFCGP